MADAGQIDRRRFVKSVGAAGVSTVTEASRNRTLSTNLPHATQDKAHTLGGYLRYTADGTLISETRSVGIRVYVNGNWASAGGLGQVTHHDRSNSKG